MFPAHDRICEQGAAGEALVRRDQRQSLIALPVLYLAAACALGLLVRQLDARREVELPGPQRLSYCA